MTMSVKLVADGISRIHEADSFTISEEAFEVGPAYCRKVSAHYSNGEGACWWVGNPPYEVDESRVFSAAYVMNSNGKTIEVLCAPPIHPSLMTIRQSARA